MRDDEGMAYAFEYMYRIMYEIRINVQNKVSQRPTGIVDEQIVALAWSNAWESGYLPMTGYMGLYTDKSFPISGVDFGRLRNLLGAQIRCSDISQELNTMAKANKWCLRFSCDHNESSGYAITGSIGSPTLEYVAPPKREIHEALK